MTYPELTIIIVGDNNCYDVQKTMDSIAYQTFTDYSVIGFNDECSVLYYLSQKSIDGDFVLFLKVGDILATQMTLEENLRMARRSENVDIVFSAYGYIKDGFPYTYDKHSDSQLSPNADNISSVINFVTSSKVYGRMFRKCLFYNLELSLFSGFTPDLMAALVCQAKDISWSPNGLCFYQYGKNEHIDDFRFAFNLISVLREKYRKNNIIFANCFFVVLNRMLKLKTNYNSEFEEELIWFSENVPNCNCLFHRMKNEDKQDLMLIKILGFRNFIHLKTYRND